MKDCSLNTCMSTNFSEDIKQKAQSITLPVSEQFGERWTCPWYLYPFARLIYGKAVALKRSVPWSFTKAGILESNERAAKEKSGIDLDEKADKNSGAVPQDVLQQQFSQFYKNTLKNFKGSGFIDVIKNEFDKETSLSNGLRDCVHNFCIAFDSFEKTQTRYDNYINNNKVLRAQEELAQAGKDLVDWWYREKTDLDDYLNLTDAPTIYMVAYLKDCNVAEPILEQVLDYKKYLQKLNDGESETSAHFRARTVKE